MRYNPPALIHFTASRSAWAAIWVAASTSLACDGWTWFDEGPRRPADGSPLTLKVLGTRQCTPAEASFRKGSPPAPLLGIELEITGWLDAGVPANYFYASLEDDEGRRHLAQEGCEPLLAASPLGPGQRARGYVSFAVPESARKLTLIYAPRLLEEQDEPKTFRVSLDGRE